MTRREDNSLLDVAQAHHDYCREVSDGIQVIAACVAVVGLILGCFLVLHFQVPM